MKNFLSFKDIAISTIKERRNRNINNICKYWIKILDDYLWWILENELVVIWAGSWVWKTELAIQISLENAMRDKKVSLFSLEWDVWEIVYRYFQKNINKKLNEKWEILRWPEYRLNLKNVEYYEDLVLAEIPDKINNNLKIFDKSFIPDREKLLNIIKDIRDETDLFVIDHLHYLDYGENEYSWISEIVKAIKEITEIIKKPVILISHLNRNAEKKGELPKKSDLHGSSNIEKNANTVILLTKWDNNEIFKEHEKKTLRPTKIIVDKNRTWMPVPAIFETAFDINMKEYIKEDKYNFISTNEKNRITIFDKIN